MNKILPIAVALTVIVMPVSATADVGSATNVCRDTIHSSGGTICNGRHGYVAGTYEKAERVSSVALAAPATKMGAKQMAKRVGLGAAAVTVGITAPAWGSIAVAAATFVGAGMLVYDGYQLVFD